MNETALETEGEKFLELSSNSSFVPAAPDSSNSGFQGKVVMTYEQLKATGALTPVKPNDSGVPFASPTTKRTQRAAAKLAERRKTTSPKELGSGVIGSGGGACEDNRGAVNLASDFSEETSTTATAQKSNNGKSKTASCFASPPLSGATSSGRRRFVSSQQKSGGGNKGAGCRPTSSSSRRSTGGTMASPSIGDDGERTPLKSLPLSVQREMERKKHAREASKLGSDPNFDSRRNLDKRTARLRYSGDFIADLAKHRTSLASPLAKEASCADAANNAEEATPPSSNGVEICIRKRPIFEYEIARGEFDVVAIGADNAAEIASKNDCGDVVCIHNCVMHADMRRKLVKPTYFPCTQAFDEHTTQDHIYEKVAQPMVQHAARGGISTIFMFGQTGSGKSHTMTGIEERTTNGIFDELSAAGNADAIISVQFVELAGKICRDLLGDDGEEVTLAEAKDGSVKLMGAETVEIKTPEDLAKAIELGKSRRATEATDVNGVSSRSHAVVQIQLLFKGQEEGAGEGKKEKQRRGLLNLLDLAGSERKNDSMYHSSERQKESNEINASLWALKECVRVSNKSGKNKKSTAIPYRSNNLTRLLRESFERESAKLCVIATVAPNATDTEHTMETLRFVSQLAGREKDITEGATREVVSVVAEMKKVDVAPKAYSHEQLCAFLKKKKIQVTLPKRMDGKALMKLSSNQIRSHVFGGDPTKGDASAEIFNALRKENDRVAKLQRAERLRVSQARKAGSGHA